MAGLKEKCRLDGTGAERPQWALTEASSSSPPPYERGKRPPDQ
jgi:hypothetical protein